MHFLSPSETTNKHHLEVKRPRASKPKVRSGCKTCKARRIKCDEVRPACHRCSKFGRICGGYETDLTSEKKKTEAPKSRTRLLLPKSKWLGEEVPLGPTSMLYDNDQDYYYFLKFCSKTARELTGVFDSPLWNRIILQASHHHAYIRHAVIAIGSLAEGIRTSLLNEPQRARLPGTLPFGATSRITEQEFAIWHYHKFLEGCRKALIAGSQSTRLTLIVSFLIICAETLQWNHHPALSHVWSGMDLLEEWMSHQLDSRRPLLPGISSPAPDIIEDQIFQHVRLLEVEGAWLCDPRPKEYHERLRLEGSETIQEMPEKFSDLHEAKLFLDLIIRRTHHFIGAVRPGKTGRSATPPELENPGLRTHFDELEPFDGLYEGSVENLQAEQSLYAYDITHWCCAFKTLFRSKALTARDSLASQLLKIRANTMMILLHGELATTEMVYDRFLPEFQEIVSLARSFLNHPEIENVLPEGGFSASPGVIYPLRLVADKCRDGTIRRQAISLLRSRPWREGSWWSLSLAQIGNWLMRVEEDGLDLANGEVVPEWARARLISVDFRQTENGRFGTTICIRGVGETVEIKTAEWKYSLVPNVEDYGTEE
ncbi:hypothetical protein B0J14DRAFT_127115 [Halenospora varia]|nr:hypothetical protein B0J14DRAFT_127115 [Halenospora varia]